MKFLVIGCEGSMGKRRMKCLHQLGVIEHGWDIKWGTEMPRDNYDAVIISTPPDKHEEYMCDQGYPTFCEASVIKYKPYKTVHPSCSMRFHPIVNQIRDEVKNTNPLMFTYHVGNHIQDWHPHENFKDKYFTKKETGGCREIVAYENEWLQWVFGKAYVINTNYGKLSDLDIDADDYYSYSLQFDSGIVGHILIDILSRPTYRDFKLIYDGYTKNYNLQLSAPEWESVYLKETQEFVGFVEGKNPWDYGVEEDLANLDLLEKIENGS